MDIPDRTLERLSVYRRVLSRLVDEGWAQVYSHDLASFEGLTPAQVRRDLMTIGFAGSPAKGYDAAGLLENINSLLCPGTEQEIALVGVGRLGRAILAYFDGRKSYLSIAAAFDSAEDMVNRVIHGCRCYPVSQVEQIVRERQIIAGVVAVPAAAAQEVTDALVAGGVCGLLNFAPVRLRVPEDVYVEDLYITVSMEKVAYFARRSAERRHTEQGEAVS